MDKFVCEIFDIVVIDETAGKHCRSFMYELEWSHNAVPNENLLTEIKINLP